MNYFTDTEFVEDGSTIMPISIALVSEDCRELYIELDFDEAKAEAHDFVREHVLPHLRIPQAERCTKPQACERILEFLGEDPDPMFWAYYADYDWVLLCQLFGTMIDLPDPFPKFCMDLQQWWVQLGRPKGVKPAKPKNAHDALADARWNYVFYQNLKAFEEGRVNDLKLLDYALDVIERADPEYKNALSEAIDEAFSNPQRDPMTADEFRAWLRSRLEGKDGN